MELHNRTPEEKSQDGYGLDAKRRSGRPMNRSDRHPGGTLKYSRAAGKTICGFIADGNSVGRSIAKWNARVHPTERFSERTWWRWVAKQPNGKRKETSLQKMYREAKAAFQMGEEWRIGDVGANRNRDPKCRKVEIEGREIRLRLQSPKRYGNKPDQNATALPTGPLFTVVLASGVEVKPIIKDITPKPKELPVAG